MAARSRASLPYFFIVNPRAGTGLNRFGTIAAHLRDRGLPYSAAVTTAPGDARTLAQLARSGDFRAIVSVGGDGTINEVVNGFLTPEGTVDPEAVLGIIPRGTAQDFARGLGLPLTPGPAVERLAFGEERRVDVGRIRFEDGSLRLFVNVAGVGFDAEVAGRAREVRAAMSSLPAHILGFASAFASYRNREISLVLDSEAAAARSSRCNLVVVANGPYYAAGMKLAPDALMDDGLLDVVVIGDIDKLELLLNLPRAFAGTHLAHGEVTVHRVRRLKIDSPEGARVQADGDVVGELPAEMDLLPGALRVIV
ncbi:MAG: diacylglycerol kinase family lipid kinase [Chloroflexi bacterium]|nr:diacylglycerol kinase family lipid kinase [Chloroflexota bacterium]